MMTNDIIVFSIKYVSIVHVCVRLSVGVPEHAFIDVTQCKSVGSCVANRRHTFWATTDHGQHQQQLLYAYGDCVEPSFFNIFQIFCIWIARGERVCVCTSCVVWWITCKRNSFTQKRQGNLINANAPETQKRSTLNWSGAFDSSERRMWCMRWLKWCRTATHTSSKLF